MGFALWIDRDMAWAEGTHEYRPMGAAVVAVTDRFRPRDFRAGRRSPVRRGRGFVGLFGSLEEVNDYLSRRGAEPPREAPPWL
jgi:hypothetical protein